jgi:Fe-S cluster assembly protein SufD
MKIKVIQGKITQGKISNDQEDGLKINGNTIEVTSSFNMPLCFEHQINNNKEDYELKIIVAENQQLTVIDEFTGVESNPKKIQVTYDFHLKKHARCDFLLSQVGNIKRSVLSNLDENASFEMVNAFLKIENEDVSAHCHLNGEHAEAFFKGIYFSNNKAKNKMSAIVEHHAEHTYSNLVYKGILDDMSKVEYHGCVVLDKEAQHSSSSQLNKNVLLSERAKIISKPELKVFADDVKATHGSTVGELSDEELFYFQSRGISQDEAQKMILQGFLKSVAFGVRNKALSEIVAAQVGEVVS